MSMTITINPENLTDHEKELLRSIIGEPEGETHIYREVVENPYRVRKIQDAVLNCITDKELLTATEIAHLMELDVEGVAPSITALLKKGEIDRSTDRPSKYFLKSSGNPQLNDLLKNVKRRATWKSTTSTTAEDKK